MNSDSKLLPMLAGGIAGAAGATYLNAAMPQYAYPIGADAAGQGGVTIQPGLMAGLALGVAVAVLGKKMPASNVVAYVANGAIISEGGDLLQKHVVPMILPAPGALAPASPVPPGALNQGVAAMSGYGQGAYGLVGACAPGGATDLEIANMMRVYEQGVAA